MGEVVEREGRVGEGVWRKGVDGERGGGGGGKGGEGGGGSVEEGGGCYGVSKVLLVW